MGKQQVHASRRLTTDDTAELIRRALVAHVNAGGEMIHGAVPVTARMATKTKPGDGGEVHYLHHVVVHVGAEVLAVYRVRNDNLGLRRMARPPKDLVRLKG